MLNELTGADRELAAAILVAYVDSSGSDLAALRAALDQVSVDEVRRHAHRMKGASQTVGAHEVATLAARLETAASTMVDDWPELRATADELEGTRERATALSTPTSSVS